MPTAKIYYLGILRNDKQPAVELAVAHDLSSFSRFTRGSYQEFMDMFARTVAERTKAGVRQDVEEKDYVFHSYSTTQGLCALAITEASYPKLTAHQLLSKIMEEFTTKYPASQFSDSMTKSLPLPTLDTYVTQWQNTDNVDSIAKVQRELDETKIVLHKTIESVLERGEKIDSLVQKSDGLSAQSKMFYQQAKKQNSCCVVM
ncbi:hypothetical protein R6Q59_009940 [Mikania micrantha]